jgi:polysaccharide pyruvyl transferase WcaK-like protein
VKVLIVGANYNNKGAQSMLFITIDEIRKRFPDSKIYFASSELIDEKNLTFRRVYYTELAKSIALGGVKGKISSIKSVVKDCVKVVVGKKNNLWMTHDLKDMITTISLIIDVSGFNLGKKWSAADHEVFLNNIRLARKYQIPMYLMPQSFGPFDYEEDKKYLLDEMRELLPYPKVIYAREREGYEMLKSTFGLQNVVPSTDLVLQNKGIDFRTIYKMNPALNVPKLPTDNNVAIIPNNQCFKFGNKEKLLAVYESIIKTLLDAKKNVYVFRHSGEDLQICKWIKGRFPDNKDVHILENDFNCFEYDEFIKNFQFVICSRYHGIVHAYQNSVPCIALGWAVKYKELTHNVGQSGYSFDITLPDFSVDSVYSALRNMIENYIQEGETIKKNVAEIQKDNCFEFRQI